MEREDILETIQRCFKQQKVLYTSQAREEMQLEEQGTITEEEVYQAIINEIIEKYEDDQPYPSILLYGKTIKERPIHIVLAYCKEDHITIVITVYQPDPKLWINYRRRRKNERNVLSVTVL